MDLLDTVIAGLDPAIHDAGNNWMPASSAGMTVKAENGMRKRHL
jgi:hypothetical protein